MKEGKIFYENEGEKIAAVLHTPNKESKKAIILLHGFRGNKDEEGGSDLFPVLSKSLCKQGFNVLRFDCRGTNESDGKFEDMTFTSEVSDLKKSIDFMRAKGNNKIAVLGCSFGGGVTLLAYKNNIDCVVLWYPLIYPEVSQSLRSLRAAHDEIMQKGKTMTINSSGEKFCVGKSLYEEWQKIDPSKNLKKLKCPTLIVTGTNDRTLSMENANKAMQEIKSTKKLEIIEGAYHCWKNENNELVEAYRKQATEATVDWIKKCL